MRKNLIALRKPQHFAMLLIILLAVVASFGVVDAESRSDGSAADSLKYVASDSTTGLDRLYTHGNAKTVYFVDPFQVDTFCVMSLLSVYAAKAESLTVIDGILIECANQANYPHNDGVQEVTP